MQLTPAQHALRKYKNIYSSLEEVQQGTTNIICYTRILFCLCFYLSDEKLNYILFLFLFLKYNN